MISHNVGTVFADGFTVIGKPASKTSWLLCFGCDLAKKIGIPASVINVATTKNVSLGLTLTLLFTRTLSLNQY